MTVTNAELRSIERCVDVALAIEEGRATFIAANLDYRAEVYKDHSGDGYCYRLYERDHPAITLCFGCGETFSGTLNRAEEQLKLLPDQDRAA